MRFYFIGCQGLYREFCREAAKAAPWLEMRFFAPCCDGDCGELQRQIDQVERQRQDGQEIDGILIGAGLCAIGEEGIISHRYPLIVPRAHDCITLLLGSHQRYREIFEENQGEVAFYLPQLEQGGLLEQVNHLPAGASVLAALTEENDQASRKRARQLASERQLICREYIRDNSMITGLLSGVWDPELFLVAQPGERCLPSFDSEILTCR